MGKDATIFYKRLAGLLAQKRHQPYSTTMGWLRTALRPPAISSPVPSRQSSQEITTHLEWPCSRPDGQWGPSWSLTLHAFLHPLLLDTFIHNLPILYFSFCCISLLYSIVLQLQYTYKRIDEILYAFQQGKNLSQSLSLCPSNLLPICGTVGALHISWALQPTSI